jgi:hypothetical protein
MTELDSKRLSQARLEHYADESGDTRYASKLNELETKTKRLRENTITNTITNIKRSMEVDLCFVLDCTGSMDEHIAAAKDCILQVVEYMERTNPNIKLWVGFCGYRDHYDGSDRLQIFDFTNSYSLFKSYISEEVPAKGGGNAPEDVLGSLSEAANNMNWRHTTRVLLHVGDSPPHGSHFTERFNDFPKGDPFGLTAESVLEDIQSKNIIYYFKKITNETDMMLGVFLRLPAETREFRQDGVCETAETSFANPLQNAEMPKLPKLLKLFRHFGIVCHMIYI